MQCIVVNLDIIPYTKALRLQEKLCALRAADKIEDHLLLLEHTPVITLGRKATPEMFRVSPIEIRKMGIEIIETDRGGNITYHGPGQIVGYPILNFTRLMERKQFTVDKYMTVLRQMLLAVLRDFGMEAWQEDGGIWVAEGHKIGATGVAVKSFPTMKVTKHGFALDVNTNLDHFSTIAPCGYVNAEATSMQKILQKKIDMAHVKQSIINLFGDAFGHTLEIRSKEKDDNLFERTSMKSQERCAWVNHNQLMVEYHDREWGVPVHDDCKLFELLILEGAQAGLTWQTVLNKRENYRKAFSDFNPSPIARYDDEAIQSLLVNPGIIRNRLKIAATIQNAKMFLKIQKEFGSFDTYIWQFVGNKSIKNQFGSLKEIPTLTKESDTMSKDLLKRGFKFVGSTICYAFMQAVGMVNDHQTNCFRYHEVKQNIK